VFSLYLIFIGLSDCPTQAVLHVLHFISYIPPGFVLSDFCDSCWYMVLLALKAILMLVFLNRLVTFLTKRLRYVNVTHFLSSFFILFVVLHDMMLIQKEARIKH
jgi:hypothetical protein